MDMKNHPAMFEEGISDELRQWTRVCMCAVLGERDDLVLLAVLKTLHNIACGEGNTAQYVNNIYRYIMAHVPVNTDYEYEVHRKWGQHNCQIAIFQWCVFHSQLIERELNDKLMMERL